MMDVFPCSSAGRPGAERGDGTIPGALSESSLVRLQHRDGLVEIKWCVQVMCARQRCRRIAGRSPKRIADQGGDPECGVDCPVADPRERGTGVRGTLVTCPNGRRFEWTPPFITGDPTG